MNTASSGERRPLPAKFGSWFIRGLFNLGVAILFLLLLWSISIQIAPAPDYQKFIPPVVDTKERCEAAGGAWREGVPDVSARPAPVSIGEKGNGHCEGPLNVDREREAQQRTADRAAFFVFVLGGTAALVAAVPLMRFTPVAPGFLMAGVIALLISTGKLWQFAGSLARLVTIAALLIVVAVAGGYFFRDRRSAPGDS